MEAAYSFEMLVHFYQNIRQPNIEDSVQCIGCWVYFSRAFQEHERNKLFYDEAPMFLSV